MTCKLNLRISGKYWGEYAINTTLEKIYELARALDVSVIELLRIDLIWIIKTYFL